MFNKKDEIIKERPAPSPYLALFYINRKENNIEQKLRKTRQAYSKERRRQQDCMGNELARIDKLLEAGSINEDLHKRYMKILEIDYTKKRLETREKYGFKTHPHKF
jgi:hypothetical protein